MKTKLNTDDIDVIQTHMQWIAMTPEAKKAYIKLSIIRKELVEQRRKND